MQQAVEELGIPRLKQTRPVPSYKGQLTLGNPNQYDSAMCIDVSVSFTTVYGSVFENMNRILVCTQGLIVCLHPLNYASNCSGWMADNFLKVERYPRTYVRAPPSASQFVQRLDLSNGHASTQSSATVIPEGDDVHIGPSRQPTSNLTNVRNARTYQVSDEEAPGGKRDVDRDDLAKGYEYGRTAVHISESDENVTKLETHAVFEIIGFIPWANVSHGPAILSTPDTDVEASTIDI